MLQGLAQSSGRRSEHARDEVLRNAQSSAVPPEIFDAALRHVQPISTHAELRALFDNRVTERAVKHWRRGRRRPPRWACEILKAKLAAQCGELQRIIDRL